MSRPVLRQRPLLAIGLCLVLATSIVVLRGHTSGAANGLVAAYAFSEGSGGTVADLSGSGNTGTIRGATWTTSGKYGNALSFNATSKNDWVTINDSASLRLTNGMTLEAWVRPNTLGTGNTAWRTALVKEQTAQLSYALYANTDTGRPSGHAYTSGDMDTRGNNQLALNTWTHISATYDGSNLRFYTNGVLQSTKAVTGSMVSANKPLRIGGNSIWGEWFGGQIDEVRVYNRALTATELQSDMNTAISSAPDTAPPSTPTNLTVGSTTQTTIGLNWTASSDNVGVTGYGLYNGATLTGSVTANNGTVTGLSCGTMYILGVDAYDAATNRSSQATTVAQTTPCNDTVAPSTPTNLSAGTATATAIPVSWTASTDNIAVAGYTLYKDGANAGTTSSTSSTFNGLVCGTSYTLGIDAYDGAGNHSSQATITTRTAACDTTAPAVAITSPADGAIVAGTVAVSATSSDDVAVAGVQFKLDGNNIGSEDISSPYGISWNTIGLSNGAHVLTTVSRDTSNNTTTSSSVNVMVNNDITSPTVSISAPTDGSTVSGSSVTVSATATDDIAVTGVQFKLDGNNLQSEAPNSPYQITWNSTAVSNGTHTFTAVARDAAGNTATATNITIIVSNAAPTTPTPVPGATTNGITVASGYVEATSRQVIRTTNNVVYVITADDNPCQQGSSNKGVIRVSKGTGAQSSNANVPTAFSEMDTANHPASTSSGSCQVSPGSALFSPDSRLDRNGIIHMAYIDTAPGGTVYYQTFSTLTDTYGPRTVIATGAETIPGAGWARGGQLALTLDANDIPYVVYTTLGTNNTVRYTNKVSGSWSTPATIYSGTNEMKPSMVTSLDGALHLTWLDNSVAAHSTVLYARYSGGAWSSVETVSAGDTNVLNNTNDDQGPSVATDAANRPHVLYMDGNPNASNDYVRMRYRTTAGAWTDNTPPGTSGGASSSAGNWFAHTPQNYISSTGDEYVFLGHDDLISPVVFSYQTGGPGNNWSAAKQMDPRNKNNTTAGASGIDGSASIRFDPLRDNNTGIIDVVYYDENDGTAGYDHHGTVYYKAVAINGMGGGPTDTTAPTVSVTAPTGGSTVSSSTVTLSANASDNVGVAGVQFKVDGSNVGTEASSSPYQISWNSTSVSNGSHTITAVARDAAGNMTTSSSVNVTVSNTTSPTVLVGNQTLQTNADSNTPGKAEAFQYTASASGTLNTVKIYVDTGSTGVPLIAGVYTDNGGHPGTLIGQGSLSSPVSASWNTVTISGGGNVTSGSSYWIAILSPSGTLKFRDKVGGGHSETSSQSTLTTLPATWTTGLTFTDSMLSAYGSQ